MFKMAILLRFIDINKSQGIIQKKSASGSQMLPIVIFDEKCPFLKIVLF